MHTEAERTFYRRLYILIGLTAAILCSLFYLLYLTRIRNRGENYKEITFHKVSKQDRIIVPERDILIAASGETASSDTKSGTEDSKTGSDGSRTDSGTGDSGSQSENAGNDSESAGTDSGTEKKESGKEEGRVANTAAADIDGNSSLLRIVSPARRIEAEYVPDGLTVPDVPMYQTQMLRSDAAGALEDMFAAAAADGYDLYLISGYRSYDYQTGLWDYYTDYYGSDYTERMDARPGGSEHQLGLSVDIGTTDNVCRLDVCFGDTGAYSWLQNNSYRYGYIERYPADGEGSTGIMYSPWSFRYTGRETAEKIYSAHQTMEEYFHIN